MDRENGNEFYIYHIKITKLIITIIFTHDMTNSHQNKLFETNTINFFVIYYNLFLMGIFRHEKRAQFVMACMKFHFGQN